MARTLRQVRRGETLLLAAVLGLLAALALASVVTAEGTPPPPERQVTVDEVNRLAKRLYCPVCENIPLDVCPTQACVQWRATIREKLVAGWSDQAILDYFSAQYGERVLAQPSTRGLNVLVWVLPPASLVVGGAVLWAFLRRAARAPAGAAAPAASPAPADPYAARFEAELLRRQ
jgi:cytochrome c-type biogenesis protein CcmH